MRNTMSQCCVGVGAGGDLSQRRRRPLALLDGLSVGVGVVHPQPMVDCGNGFLRPVVAEMLPRQPFEGVLVIQRNANREERRYPPVCRPLAALLGRSARFLLAHSGVHDTRSHACRNLLGFLMLAFHYSRYAKENWKSIRNSCENDIAVLRNHATI